MVVGRNEYVEVCFLRLLPVRHEADRGRGDLFSGFYWLEDGFCYIDLCLVKSDRDHREIACFGEK